MAQRCALIVDDSRTARQLLGEMLAANRLRVETAESAEEALEYLSRSRPDVIFMDHMMPGMDGFQAVRAIKSNPATATIPIMMYTSQEGEVYVGQARALGAVGVLPKQIKPVEVSEVLKSLHLLGGGAATNAEHPGAAATLAAETPEPLARYAADVATDLNSRDWTDLHRWLQEMFEHLGRELRTDIESSVGRLLRDQDADRMGARRRRWPVASTMTTVLMVALAGLAAVFFWLHLDTERKWRAAVDQNAGLMAALNSRRSVVSARAGDAILAQDAEHDALTDQYQGFLAALEWGVNKSAAYPPDESPLGDERLETVNGLIRQLTQLGFTGVIRLESHMGDFCYVSAGSGALSLAPDDLPAERCDRVGLPADEARAASARQSVEFANFLASRNAAANIRVEIEPHGNTSPQVAYPSLQGVAAGEWNKIARQNNRVSIRIVPDRPSR